MTSRAAAEGGRATRAPHARAGVLCKPAICALSALAWMGRALQLGPGDNHQPRGGEHARTTVTPGSSTLSGNLRHGISIPPDPPLSPHSKQLPDFAHPNQKQSIKNTTRHTLRSAAPPTLITQDAIHTHPCLLGPSSRLLTARGLHPIQRTCTVISGSEFRAFIDSPL